MSQSRSKTSRARSGGRGPVGAARSAQRPRRNRSLVVAAVVAVVVLIGLFIVYRSNSAADTGAAAGSDRFDVGSPGIGAMAPEFTLPDVTAPPAAGGGPATVALSAYRGRTVLLYFHEGLGCQPCWDQIRDLQKDPGALRALGVDQLLTITSGPLDLVAQKMHDDALTAPARVDTGLRVSTTYQANRYGMMGTSRDGHSFVLVGPDGRIEWRARLRRPAPVHHVRPGRAAGRGPARRPEDPVIAVPAAVIGPVIEPCS